MNAKQIKDDTVTILLSNAINRYLNTSERAKRIRKCAKYICQRTEDKQLKNACRSIRNEKNDSLVIKAIDNAEYSYFMNC